MQEEAQKGGYLVLKIYMQEPFGLKDHVEALGSRTIQQNPSVVWVGENSTGCAFCDASLTSGTKRITPPRP